MESLGKELELQRGRTEHEINDNDTVTPAKLKHQSMEVVLTRGFFSVTPTLLA